MVIFMKLYIDISVLTLATYVTGIQRVTREVTVRFLENSNFETVLLHYNAADNCYYRINNLSFLNYYIRQKGVKEKMITKTPVKLEEIAQGCIFFDLDAVWMGRIKRSYLLPVLKRQGAKIAVHIYDIIPVTHPQYCLQRGVYCFMDYIGAHLIYADVIITNAGATAGALDNLADAVKTPLPPCHIVPLGADFNHAETVWEKEVGKNISTAAMKRPFLLMVGTLEPRKNHKLLLSAYDRGLKKMGCNLIFAGAVGWNMEQFTSALNNHPDYGTHIFHFEGLNDQEIFYLYQKAQFVVFPSYTEGFGLPVVEAFVHGTPVLAADIPVLREVGKEYAVYFKQDDADELCTKVMFYTEHNAEYEKIKQKLLAYRPISWKDSADKMEEIFMEELQ